MNFHDMNATVKRSSNRGDSFNEVLRNSSNYFAEQNVQMFSGFQEILAEQGLFTEYVSQLTQDMNADDAMLMEQLMENARYNMLSESTVTQLTPIAGLSMPVIRKMWLKTCMKDVIPTEVAKRPAFTIAWLEPYLIDMEGNKVALPQDAASLRKHTRLINIPMPKGGMALNQTHNLLAMAQSDPKIGVKPRDAIDPIVHLIDIVKEDGTSVVAGEQALRGDVAMRVKLDVHSGFYAKVRLQMEEGGPVTVHQLFGNMDCESGEFTCTMVPAVEGVGVKVSANLTAENNERSTSVSFDVRTKDVRIGVGQHFNAELPIEFLQDSQALYNIDATVESVDLMSNVISQSLDAELLEFLDDCNIENGQPFTGEFDVRPTAGFAGSPTEWRHELRTCIEWWANRLKEHTHMDQGYFVIVGNPIDLQLIPDIRWEFRGAVAEQGGVHVNYDFGVMTASNVFKVMASQQVVSGELRIIFIPSSDRQMTYKYYPYSFNIEKGYRSPNQTLVPSIMMTKRHTKEVMYHAQARIRIIGNDGRRVASYAL